MNFSKATGYAIRALAYMAREENGGPCGLRDIAEDEQIPPVYLRKLLGELRRHRLLKSMRGIHGGYQLARPASSITLWEVYQILEPDPGLETCLLSHGPCQPHSGCPLQKDWQRVRREVIRLLQNRTIAQMAGPEGERTGPAAEVKELSLESHRSRGLADHS